MNVALMLPDGHAFRVSAADPSEVRTAAAAVIRQLRETCTIAALAATRLPRRRPLTLTTRDGSPSVAARMEAHDVLAYVAERVDWQSIQDWATNNMIPTNNRTRHDILSDVNTMRREYLLPPLAISARA